MCRRRTRRERSASIELSLGEPVQHGSTLVKHLRLTVRQSLVSTRAREIMACDRAALSSVLLVTISFCQAQASCIMLCSMHRCALSLHGTFLEPWTQAAPWGGTEESTVWPTDTACTSSAR